MGKTTGFMEYKRASTQSDPVSQRLKNYREFEKTLEEKTARDQGARCMDCGVAFCHGETGCPVDNLIPEFNDFVYRGQWQEALEHLHATNNFPEFTGRLCPAPCESACVLGLTDPPVAIKAIERSVIDRGFSEGWIKPRPSAKQTGKKVAVVGSGPAGLACAQQLARAGHQVTVFEKNSRVGGLLRYGIPDFKMEKFHIDRRVEQMEAEGVKFVTGVCIGETLPFSELQSQHDAVVLAMGSEKPRDLPAELPGRQLSGIHFAMDFLTAQNRVNGGERVQDQILAAGKNVLIIGGGDTGSDCVGTSHRQGARSVTQIEIAGEPPRTRDASTPWPFYPKMLYTSSSHEEGGTRRWGIQTLGFKGNERGEVQAIYGQDQSGAAFEWPVDLVLLAIGFIHPTHEGLLAGLQKGAALQLDARGNVKASFGTRTGSFLTSVPGVYACGDVRRGQSLIVWAISEGRKCAEQVHRALMAGANR